MAIAVELVAVHRAALAKAGEAKAKSTISTIDKALMAILFQMTGSFGRSAAGKLSSITALP
jgi:hypothetical protein